ncbi:MAG: Vps62-related protein [bacterium]|nr:Vps62-related protein [bacterium]
MGSHGITPKNVFAVRELEAGVLAKPLYYVKIWDDSGSGGSHDVKFWKPIPPSGYTCLGHVVIRSYSETPSTDLIRCVKSEYVSSASNRKVWDDSGSGADDDAGIWEAVPFTGDEHGLPTNTFISRESHSAGSEQFSVLNKNYIEGMGFASVPSSTADWEALASKFAPIVYMHSNEEFFPSDVEYHLANTTVQNNGGTDYLTAAISCANCTNQAFLYGKNPNSNQVPLYAMIIQKNAPSSSTNGLEPGDEIIDIVYWMFYPYNRGKWVNPVLWDGLTVFQRQPAGTYTGSLSWLNYSGRWGNPEQACISQIGVCRLENGPTGPMDKNAANPAYLGLD